MRTVLKITLLLACLVLAGCAQTPPPVVQAKVVQVDVPIPVRCIDPAKVPAPVPPADLSGEVQHDVSVLAKTDLALRSSVDQLMALVSPCTITPSK